MTVKRLVSIKELKTVFGIPYCRQHLAKLEKAGKFPKRIRLGQNRVAYLELAIVEWIEERLAESDASNSSS